MKWSLVCVVIAIILIYYLSKYMMENFLIFDYYNRYMVDENQNYVPALGEAYGFKNGKGWENTYMGTYNSYHKFWDSLHPYQYGRGGGYNGAINSIW
jgi:hypothetical protein